MLDAVVAVVKQQGVRPMSCREGEFKVGTVTVKVFNVLFDTGALHKSYVSSDLVEKHRDSWKEFILPIVQWPDWQTSGRKLKPAK